MICQDGFITSHAVENIEFWMHRSKSSLVNYIPEEYLLNRGNRFLLDRMQYLIL